MQVNLQII